MVSEEEDDDVDDETGEDSETDVEEYMRREQAKLDEERAAIIGDKTLIAEVSRTLNSLHE